MIPPLREQIRQQELAIEMQTVSEARLHDSEGWLGKGAHAEVTRD